MVPTCSLCVCLPFVCRDYLAPASGFQSLQFRLIENKLGINKVWRTSWLRFLSSHAYYQFWKLLIPKTVVCHEISNLGEWFTVEEWEMTRDKWEVAWNKKWLQRKKSWLQRNDKWLERSDKWVVINDKWYERNDKWLQRNLYLGRTLGLVRNQKSTGEKQEVTKE